MHQTHWCPELCQYCHLRFSKIQMRALGALSLQLGSPERTVEEAQASQGPSSLQDSKRRIQDLECAHGLTESEHLGCFICHSLPPSLEGRRSGCLLHCQSLCLRQTVHPLKSIGRKSIICKDGPFPCCFRLSPFNPKNTTVFPLRHPLGDFKGSSVFAILPFSSALMWSCFVVYPRKVTIAKPRGPVSWVQSTMTVAHCVVVPLSFPVSPTEDCMWK